MGKNYFTPEQVEELRKNNYIKAHSKRDLLNCEIDVDNLAVKVS